MLRFILLVVMVMQIMGCEVGKENIQMWSDYYPGYEPGFELKFGGKYGKPKCKISPSQYEKSESCIAKRKYNIHSARLFYKFKPGLPILDQSMQTLKYHTALDPVDSRWLVLYSTFKHRNRNLYKDMIKKMANSPFNSFKEYKNAYSIHQEKLKLLKSRGHFTNPATESSFKDILEDDHWMSDEMFVQQRVAGPCPFLMKKVTMNDDVGLSWYILEKYLNPNYRLVQALNHAVYPESYNNITEAVAKGMIYVLFHEDVGKGTQVDGNDELKHILSTTSPITLLVNKLSGDLKVFAIQWDSDQGSSVFSPESYRIDWLFAKAMANLADSRYCDQVWRKSHIHLSSSIYCNIFKRHLSELHPLHQIMRYHCEGTTPYSMMTYDKMMMASFDGKLPTLVQNGLDSYDYGTLAYDEILTKHGLDSTQIKYYPFRDDGKIIWREICSFAKEFVRIYYKSDVDVHLDQELQDFANEISADVKYPSDSKGRKISRFPTHFSTSKQLEIFVSRFVWQIVMNAVITYTAEPWRTFVPLTPAKLYRSKLTSISQNMAYSYQDALSTLNLMSTSTMMGNFRVNRIMDYFDKLDDQKLKDLVQNHYHNLHTCIQLKLEERNKERQLNGFMGLQHLEPKWLPNSFHI